MVSVREMFAVRMMVMAIVAMVVIRLGRKLLANRRIRGTVIIAPTEQIQRDKDGCQATFIIYLLFLLLFNTSFNK